jgi:hypothetical protein
MKFSYKRWLTVDKWKTTNSFKVLEKEIAKLGRGSNDVLEIRRFCEHRNKWSDQGIITCKDCGEQLEITSYRD